MDLLDKFDSSEQNTRNEGLSFADVLQGDLGLQQASWFGANEKNSDTQVQKSGFPSVLMWDSSKEALKDKPSDFGTGGPPSDAKFEMEFIHNKVLKIELTPQGEKLSKPHSETKPEQMGATESRQEISFGGGPGERPVDKAQQAISENLEHQQKYNGQKPLNVEAPQKAPTEPLPVQEPTVEITRPVEPKVTLVENATAIERQIPKTTEELMAGIKATCAESKAKAFEQIQKTAAEFMERNGMKIPGPGKVVALVLAGGILLGAAPPAQASEKGDGQQPSSRKDNSVLGNLEAAQPYLKGALDVGAFLPPTAAACIIAGVCESVSEPVIAQFSGKNGAELKASMEDQRDLGCLAWMLDPQHSRFPLDGNGNMMGLGEIRAHAIVSATEIMTKAKAEAHKGMRDGVQSIDEIILEGKRRELMQYLHEVGTAQSLRRK